MTFFSILLALLIEQGRALSANNFFYRWIHRWVSFCLKNFDTGGDTHSRTTWLLIVLPPTISVALVYALLVNTSFILAFAWNVFIVYLTLGFRQFSHHFTQIHLALQSNDQTRAQELLAQWTGLDTQSMNSQDIIRNTLLYATLKSHRHVFGVFFWFLLPIGPAGAVFYRLAAYMVETPAGISLEKSHMLLQLSKKIFYYIDYLPVRLTAIGFAIVGRFEEAIDAWRNNRSAWPHQNLFTQADLSDDAIQTQEFKIESKNDALLLAVASGALGTCIINKNLILDPMAIETPGSLNNDYSIHTLDSAIGFGWRSMVLWMTLLLLLTLTVWIGKLIA